MSVILAPMSKQRSFDGAKLREARLATGLSQDELARKLAVGVRNVSRWETGANEPRFEHVAAISEATGQPLEFFRPTPRRDGGPGSGPHPDREGADRDAA